MSGKEQASSRQETEHRRQLVDLPRRWEVKMGQERNHEEDKEAGVNSKGKGTDGNITRRYPGEIREMSLLRPSKKHYTVDISRAKLLLIIRTKQII